MYINGIIFALALIASVVVHGEDQVAEKIAGVETNATVCLICQVAVIDIEFENDKSFERFRCLTKESQESDKQSEMSYDLDLPSDFVRINKDRLNSGVSNLCIRGGSAVRTEFGSPDYVVIPTGAELSFVGGGVRHQRRLEQTGTRSVLVVRVNTPYETLTNSAVTLANGTFGIGGQPFSLASQYSSCSFGKLKFVAASGYSAIKNGVVDINLGGSVAGIDSRDLENDMIEKVKAALGVNELKPIFDHFLFCLPPGSLQNGASTWIAYAYTRGQFTFFNDAWCSSLTATMHEVGHNLGLAHSGENGISYSDQSCLMGYSYRGAAAPRMCFNGHKNHVLGWYADKQITVNPAKDGAWYGKLVGFVDYPKADTSRNEYVLIVLDALFIQFNLAEEFNIQTKKYQNLVTITTAPDDASKSSMLSALSANSNVVIGNYTIEVCNMVYAQSSSPKYMALSIRLNSQTSRCWESGGLTAAPATAAPTTHLPTILIPVSSSLRPTSVIPKTRGPDTLAPTSRSSTTAPPTSVPSNSVLFRQAPVPVLPTLNSDFCFSGETTVLVKNRGLMLMKHLNIGDEVLAASGSYEQVYSFGHRHEHITGEFLQFSPSGIEISRDHMIMLGGRFVPASQVKIGDKLETVTGDTLAVEAIERVVRSGVYAPFTASGTIVVNGIKASNYVAFQGSEYIIVGNFWESPLTFQWIAHLSQSPHRVLSRLGLSGDEEYTKDGMSTWIAGPHEFSKWLLEQNGVVMTVILVPAVGFGLLSVAVEGIVSWFR